MKRKIVHIHEHLCNGCALCVDACHEGAIEIVNGVAKLVNDIYCDGLGACLPECPTGAIELIEREAEAFDEAAVELRVAQLNQSKQHAHPPREHQQAHHTCHQGMGGCPGSMSRMLERTPRQQTAEVKEETDKQATPSELQTWPIQLSLVHPQAPFLRNADLLIAADCTAFAYGEFHREFLRGRVALIGCPKLDDTAYYVEKLSEILKFNRIRSITVVRMSVPCCGGIVQAVKTAMLRTETILPYREAVVTVDGELAAR